MIQKIFERIVMRMGREPEHSLTVTIPKKICESLQIEKGTRLYFKLEENRFVVSRDIKSLDGTVSNNNYTNTAIDSMEPITKENGNKKKEIMVDGVSLVELQY
ncbi:MAG TPA: AbrB/MazE/SpoVT family DNA-binding domain-containing protein [Candidatus Nitrosotalea sp.]|nr:AbrB/MazE/SpoVT family DNA-binding domain-containing protein [Candidatus Nitrosotalea sp.]